MEKMSNLARALAHERESVRQHKLAREYHALYVQELDLEMKQRTEEMIELSKRRNGADVKKGAVE